MPSALWFGVGNGKLYFHMPEALTTAGGVVEVGPDFAPHVVEDRELITGQNPRSDHSIAAKLVAALDRYGEVSRAVA